MRHRLAMAVGVLLVVAACDSGSSDPGTPVSTTESTILSTTSTWPQTGDSVPTSTDPVSEAEVSVEFLDRDEVAGRTADLMPAVAGTADESLVLDLEECLLAAPGTWRYSGTAVLPDGVVSAEALVELHLGQEDMAGTAAMALVTFSGSGRFSVTIEDPPGMRTGINLSYVDQAEWCAIEVSAASLPVEVRGLYGSMPVTRSTEPLVWNAPADTVQALGIGAVMADLRDPRLPWAYFVWSGATLPLEAIWLPEDFPASEIWKEASGRDVCRSVTVAAQTGVRARTSIDCLDVYEGRIRGALPGTAVEGLPGFTLFEDRESGRLTMVAEIEGATVSLNGAPGSEDNLVRLASELRPFGNLEFRVPRYQATVGPDLDAVIAALVQTDAGWEETLRAEVSEDLWFVHLSRLIPRGDDPALLMSSARFVTVLRIDGIWVAEESGGRGGGGPRCVDAGGLDRWPYRGVWFVVADPSFGLQERRDDGWHDIPMDAGAGFVLYDSDTVIDSYALPWGDLRAVDAEGRIVRCSDRLTSLEEGEEWSPWREPLHTRDLPVQITPSEGLQDGDTITITGSGFQNRRAVQFRICSEASSYWDDWWDCDIGWLGRVRADEEAAFTFTVEVPATFTTRLGNDIDCRLETCIIRASTAMGALRTGWAPITFASSD